MRLFLKHADSREIIDLLSSHPKGLNMYQLERIVTKRFGTPSGFRTGSLMSRDLEDLLVVLETRRKVRLVNGMIYPRIAPVYVH